MMWWRALAVWLLMAAAESVHGALRELFTVPVLGRPAAQQLGFFTGCVIILTVAILTAPWLRAGTRAQQWRVGAFWVALMLCLEFGLGLVRGLPLSRIIDDYNPARGGLMLFGMLLLLLSPLVGARLRTLRRPA